MRCDAGKEIFHQSFHNDPFNLKRDPQPVDFTWIICIYLNDNTKDDVTIYTYSRENTERQFLRRHKGTDLVKN